jgi:hypothetical protein
MARTSLLGAIPHQQIALTNNPLFEGFHRSPFLGILIAPEGYFQSMTTKAGSITAAPDKVHPFIPRLFFL